LYMAMELASQRWKLCFSNGERPRTVTVEAAARAQVRAAIARAKQKFGLAAECRVVSGYEAGRDGFWIHRWLERKGSTIG
ncbi:MAG: IS110 family transposase, partial [Candidatus Acidiferrales bacterium]